MKQSLNFDQSFSLKINIFNPSPDFKILNTEKKFILKLQQNSEIWQIYCIRQPKKCLIAN
ncbi:hypothetical protein BpHYR1_037463 [Brachionus plicatilis]|uniref:Uncharacterized protein n=1 Tax=Brachionus plicatilis TaxID=10195 RepID=A0A3M7S6G7_BRAPC|nr:hypothetical protein BpHYR1_037463 [Brachionus plicatilis]